MQSMPGSNRPPRRLRGTSGKFNISALGPPHLVPSPSQGHFCCPQAQPRRSRVAPPPLPQHTLADSGTFQPFGDTQGEVLRSPSQRRLTWTLSKFWNSSKSCEISKGVGWGGGGSCLGSFGTLCGLRKCTPYTAVQLGDSLFLESSGTDGP